MAAAVGRAVTGACCARRKMLHSQVGSDPDQVWVSSVPLQVGLVSQSVGRSRVTVRYRYQVRLITGGVVVIGREILKQVCSTGNFASGHASISRSCQVVASRALVRGHALGSINLSQGKL